MIKLISLAALAAMLLTGCEAIEKLETASDAGYVGTMTVLFLGSEVQSDNVKIDVVYGEGETLTLKFNQVKFVPQMPVSLDINVAGVPYQKSEGIVSFSGTDIVPTYGLVNTEMPNYTVTNLKGTIKDDVLDFTLNFGSIPTSYTGSKLLAE